MGAISGLFRARVRAVMRQRKTGNLVARDDRRLPDHSRRDSLAAPHHAALQMVIAGFLDFGVPGSQHLKIRCAVDVALTRRHAMEMC
jgi:hypothetical protein